MVSRGPRKTHEWTKETTVGVITTEGGGQYATYLVQDSTGNILWNSDQRKHNWFDKNEIYSKDKLTAYVAKGWRSSDEAEPKHVSELQWIIADNKNLKDLPSGVKDKKEMLGGRNLDMKCNVECYGDPINSATGEFFERKVDISTSGEDLTPQFERNFSTSRSKIEGSLGFGWRSNYEMTIKSLDSNSQILDSNELALVNENGSEIYFHKNDENQYVAKSNTLASLKFDNIRNVFSYYRNLTKETFIFDQAGKLIEIKNEDNQTITISYDSLNRITTVSDAIGNNLNFSYNDNNYVSSITSQTGLNVSYTYENKNLVSIIDDHDRVFSYKYDSTRRVQTLTNALGGVTQNFYDYAGKIKEQIDPLGSSLRFTYSRNSNVGGKTVITHPNGSKTEESYSNGRLIFKKEYDLDSNSRSWQYTYDKYGNITSTFYPDFSYTASEWNSNGDQISFRDRMGNITKFVYDDRNNLVKIIDALGFETLNTYDDKNNLISTKTPRNEITTFKYNTNNQLIETTDARGNESNSDPEHYTSSIVYLENRLAYKITNSDDGVTSSEYDSYGNVISVTDAKGNKSKFEYSNLRLPVKATDTVGNEKSLTYDQVGNVLTSENEIGVLTSYKYDSLGNLKTVTNSLNETTSYSYNDMNEIVSVTSSDGSVQNIKRDGFGRPIELIDEIGNVIKQTWDSDDNLIAAIDQEGEINEYSYDLNGNLIIHTNPIGAETKYSYDALQRLVSITDPLDRVTKYVYDENSNIVEEIAPDTTSVKTVYDSVGNVVETINEDGKSKFYTFDSLNRQTSYTNETGQVTSYGYDATSNLTSQTRPDGGVVTYSYDARNLLTKIDYPGTEEDISYVYDKIGRKISETKGSKDPTLYSYDSLNRIISQGSTANKVSYEYNAAGDLTKMTYPSGRVVDYGFDAAGQLTNIDTPRVQGMTLGHNNRGQETNAVLPNGVTETKSYDAAGRLLGSELTAADNSIYKRTQQYSAANEVTQKGVYSNEETISLDDFAYDPTSKLISQKKSGTDESINSYGYNAVGNLSAINTDDQVHDVAGKIVSSADSSIGYDARNNRSSITNAIDASENVEYVWAQNNLLSEVTTHVDSISKTTKYEYSAGSLLESRSEGSITDNFVWDTNREIPVMLSDGKFEYLYKGNDRVPFAQVEIVTDIVTYLHSDLTGSIVASTDSDGSLIGRVDYSPYGEPTDTALSRFGYAGEWVDETTGCSFLRARWLDVKTGSFLSEDPLVQMTQNAFGYTEGDPLTQIDPLGLFSLGGLAKGVGDWFGDKNNIDKLSTISTGLSALSSGLAIASLIPTPLSPFLAGAASVAGVASIAVGTVATVATCSNDARANRGFSESCGWGIAGAAVSAIPVWGPLSKKVSSMESYARRNIPRHLSIVETGRVNAFKMNSKIGWGATQVAGLSTDLMGRYMTKQSDGIEC